MSTVGIDSMKVRVCNLVGQEGQVFVPLERSHRGILGFPRAQSYSHSSQPQPPVSEPPPLFPRSISSSGKVRSVDCQSCSRDVLRVSFRCFCFSFMAVAGRNLCSVIGDDRVCGCGCVCVCLLIDATSISPWLGFNGAAHSRLRGPNGTQ